MEEKKRKTYTWIGFAIGLLTFFAVKFLLFSPPTIEKANMMIASEINKTCPIMIDSETQLDNLVAQPENILAYNYTLVNMVKDSIDPKIMENAIRPMMTQMIKTHPDMEFQRKNKTTLSYNYRDKFGAHVLQFKIGPNDYKK